MGWRLKASPLSIMSILLLAVVTDYALFIVSSFREELRQHRR